MHGLTVRWSLADAGPDVAQQLREYVCGPSLARFTGLEGLAFKTWRMREGEWFEGTYVWATAQARADFLEAFRSSPSAVTQLVGHGPEVVQEWDVVGFAVGAEGLPA